MNKCEFCGGTHEYPDHYCAGSFKAARYKLRKEIENLGKVVLECAKEDFKKIGDWVKGLNNGKTKNDT
jgi:hypothetical protein